MRAAVLSSLLFAIVAGGCANLMPAAPAAAPPVSVATLYQQPGERALIMGLSLYDQGVFERAEQSFQQALRLGLKDRRDVAAAHKYLAFVACAFNRLDECATHFRSALAADPGFGLSDSEAGHPIWGPVFKRVAAAPKRTS